MTTTESIPPARLEESAPSRPDRRVVTVWRIGALVFATLFSFGAVVTALVLRVGVLGAVPPALLAYGLALYLPAAKWHAWSYLVTDTDVRINRGVWWRTASVVPLTRIQHVDTRQEPIDRAFGLAKVVIFTAGSVGAAIAIPGLAAAEAEALRDRLAALSGSEDAL